MSFLSRTRGGFTLMELMVSIGIMAFISGTIVANQSKYTSGAALKNAANDLALSLRQAQIYGISVKEAAPNTQKFDSAYGISLNTEPAPVGSDNSFIFFTDKSVPSDNLYTGSWACTLSDEECLDKTTLPTGNRISALCAIDAGTSDCTVTKLDISFLRPVMEARIRINGNQYDTGVDGARIDLQSQDGKAHSVTIYTTGQISVQ